MKLTLAFLLASGAMAACPNACSQHGECGEFDSCDCHAGFQGGDCSERVCMYNWAWVTTANGDLNFDGDRYDGTVYSSTIPLSSRMNENSPGYGGATLLPQAAPGGTWESWPYRGTAQEGHYYMECSNRGLCDRTSGDCVCFDGYQGTACNRMACPEDCSEHGICQTVKDYDSTYKLWDRDMARSCKCDPGYTGPACQTRECPHGNDPLTKTNEQWMVQWVNIFTGCEGATTTDCGTHGALTALLGGNARFTYTDHHGEAYTTDPFGVVAMDGQSAALAVATNAEAALKALPNDVISDQITVEAQYCEVAKDGAQTAASGAITGLGKNAYRIIGGTDSAEGTALIKATGEVLSIGGSGYTQASAATMANGDYQVAYLDNPICIQLKVTFVGMPGDLNLLTVDHSDVTYFGETNAQDGVVKAQVSSAVTKTVKITEGSAAVTVAYTRPSEVAITADADIAPGTTSSTITFTNGDSANQIYEDKNDIFRENTRVKVECQSTSGINTWRNLGIYTVKVGGTPTSTSILTLAETVVPSQCEGATGTETNQVRVTQVSNVLEFGNFDITQLQDFNTNHHIVCDGLTWTSTPKALSYNFLSSVGYIVFDKEDGNLAGSDFSSDTTYCSIYGTGTRENVECGDRGLCQEDGVCQCFPGYTGDSCGEQKSIAL
jgi:hypothetical protein